MKRVVEIAMFTEDVDGMATFYERLLGATPVARAQGMAIFDVGGVKLLIHETSTLAVGEPPNEDHIAYAVPDVGTACQQLAEKGLTVEIEPRDYYWGRSAYLRDPAGHLLELQEVETTAH
ncbi:MAG TPA: VOC family protein [Anaerolineae bacterium]